MVKKANEEMLNFFVDGENFKLEFSWKGEEPPGSKDLEKVFSKLREEVRWHEEEEMDNVDLSNTDQKTFDKVRSFQEKKARNKQE
jgi:hypothetical protein